MLNNVDQDPDSLSLTVIVLTCNRLSRLQACVGAILPQLNPGRDELLIIDTGSTDGTVGWLRAQPPPVRLDMFPEKPFDFGRARLFGVRQATKNYIAFTDDDAVPDSRWVASLKRNLLLAPVTGGPSIPGSSLPRRWWWSPGISWLVGNSPPGTVLGNRENYPDTSSMAFHRETFLDLQTHLPQPSTSGEIYHSGREDAEIWRQARINGIRTINDHHLAVFHHAPPDRFSPGTILKRARHDGWASWNRRPSRNGVLDMPWEMALACWNLADSTIRSPLVFSRHFEAVCWVSRQKGRLDAIRQSGEKVSSTLTARRMAQLGREHVGIAAARLKRRLHTNQAWPPDNPRAIHVFADCFVGDTILMRRPLLSLRRTFPQAEITVTARYPNLLAGIPGLVLLPSGACPERAGHHPEVGITPYFHFGNEQAWRHSFAFKSVTFDCDAGFRAPADYALARRVVPKNLELHELENLFRLFSLWPLDIVKEDVPLPLPANAKELAGKFLPAEWIASGFVTLQFGAGMEDKEWPLDRWIPFMRLFLDRVPLPIVIIGRDNWREAGEIAERELGAERVRTIVGSTLDELIAAVGLSRLCIGSCSGPKHIAMALGVPTFTLYAATEVERWGAVDHHDLHAWIEALPDRLTGTELQGLPPHHRINLLNPTEVAEIAIRHAIALGIATT